MAGGSLWQLLSEWRSGTLPDAALQQHLPLLEQLMVQPGGDLKLDLGRAARCGVPEVVYGPGKRPEHLVDAFEALANAGQPALATRLTPDQAEALLVAFPASRVNSLARTVSLGSLPSHGRRVTVITAGTSDRPVAEEAAETARWLGAEVDLICDVGVAGPQRLLAEIPRIQQAAAIVVIAGMEAALPSVVAGWTAVPVIAVPVSVGYGANFGGLAALLSMLNSCAANVTVVNIDAGFKGGYVAGLIARGPASHKANT
ncbi:MAG: 1-(5-phosphoribosyl)-5-amino-4-imidazole-carboxylate carboxylase [Planctomyces sp.]|nr:1-(5-phosphoribosyl)-5-amino-4-imidazole-carboxylate carboxylase [Planctomyces sp.]